MINQIEIFENAARIATADALFPDEGTPPQAKGLSRWLGAVYTSLLPLRRGTR